MNYENILLKKYAREVGDKIRDMNDNLFNIYKDRLVEINKILLDDDSREDLRFRTLGNLRRLTQNSHDFYDRRINVFYFLYNLNRDII